MGFAFSAGELRQIELLVILKVSFSLHSLLVFLVTFPLSNLIHNFINPRVRAVAHNILLLGLGDLGWSFYLLEFI